MTRRLCSALLAMAASVSVTGIVQAQSVLTQHVREHTRALGVQPLAQLAPERTLALDLVLPIRDEAGLKKFLGELYDPTSPVFHHYLTPKEFTAKFGPTAADYDTLVRFARANGFQVTGGSRDGMELQVKGSVAVVEKAFHVAMREYQHPTESRTYFAPDREPTTTLPFNLWHVSGLDNFSTPHPLYVKKSDYAKEHGISPEEVVAHATTGSGPSASFLGSDMRAAYYGTGSLTGAGQNLGLFEYEGTDLADLNTYYKNIGQTLPITPVLLSTDGTSTACVYSGSSKCDDGEQNLDMTQALGMAPGLASLTVYVGSVDTAIISAMTTHSPLPTTIGCSWGWTPADPSTLDPYFEKMAAQGQNFFAASGDSSTWSKRNEAWPADDAYVVSVGGTDLVTASAGGPWKSETTWVDSGGGISPDSIAIPSWQTAAINSSNKGSTTLRNGPDVSANANFTFYTCDDQTTCQANEYGGTSFAAPMWAAYIALVNQQLVANGSSTIGFLNPTIYQENETAATYAADFHDISSGTSGSYTAVTGFDLVTGWGSPNTGLIAALTGGTTATPAFAMSASPTAVTVAPGASGTSTVTTTVSGGFSSAVALSASGQPSGVTVSFSPASIASPGSGSSTVTFAVGSSVAAGSYTVTLTGTGGGLTQTATVTLTVSAVTSGFTLSASPTALTVARSASGTSTLTTAISGSFASAITLSATGEGGAQTVTFSPSSIASPGSGSSTMKVTVGRSASVGSHTITVKATGGGVTKTTTVTLTVTK